MAETAAKQPQPNKGDEVNSQTQGSSLPKYHWVEIQRPGPAGPITDVVIYVQEGESDVRFKDMRGNKQALIEELKKGVPAFTSTKRHVSGPTDGRAFLEAIQKRYSTSTMTGVSDIKTGTSLP